MVIGGGEGSVFAGQAGEKLVVAAAVAAVGDGRRVAPLPPPGRTLMVNNSLFD